MLPPAASYMATPRRLENKVSKRKWKRLFFLGYQFFVPSMGLRRRTVFFFTSNLAMKVVNIPRSQTFDQVVRKSCKREMHDQQKKFYEYKSTAHSKNEMRMVRVTNYLVFLLVAR